MVPGPAGALGHKVEQYAKRYLAARGLTTVEENFRCRMGEIDLIMLDGDCLVFVEVRFRSGRRLTSAPFTVDASKQRRLVRTAAVFLSSRRTFANSVTRFDVVGIDRNQDGTQRINWIRDAFRPADASL